MKHAQEKAETLLQAIKYIKKFEQKIVVIKYGGNAMASEELKKSVFEDIAMLFRLGLKIVVVNGAGPKIDAEMEKHGLKKQTINGLRVTDTGVLKIVEAALEEVNEDCVSHLQDQGVKAKNCTEGTFVTRVFDENLGYVGEITKAHTEPLIAALDQGHIPVVSSIGRNRTGQQTNINADTAASALAIALNAEKLTILTNVDAVTDTNHHKIPHLSIAQAESHVKDGTINGGMIPKVQACIDAVKGGVKKAHLLNGVVPKALLLEIFTEEGVGTEVVKQ